ncbi:MAG: zinc ribbon domain-containing protein [Promethearchaeota archaeon]
MDYCPNCGSKNDSESKICAYCGFNLDILNELNKKDEEIKKLRVEIENLKKNLQKPNVMQNFPFWIIPITVFIFFGLMALIVIFALR